ncbi:MAG TPA: SLC13 family permease [Rhodanobacteraceae bacterium]|jgi:di/tricarboxylate transporter|nr:SLC13 family permease [Rhodanobacteraceae bacterium]
MELTLTPDMLLVLGLVGFTVIMFVLEWVRADIVALLVLVVIGITGLMPVQQLFDGFASNAVLSLMGIMIMGAGLDRTGVLNQAAAFILRLSGGVESRVSLLLNATTGTLSSIIQSQALAALFIPVASRLSARTGVPLKRLLLPMAFCILAGTSMTLISNSPLILLNDLIASADRNLPPGAETIEPFKLFAITPIGIPLLLVGIGYFAFLTRRLMPDDDAKPKVTPGRTESYFADTYGIEGEVIELTVTADSPLVGMSIGEAETLDKAPLILAVKNGNEARLAPPADQLIWVGTVIGVLGPRAAVNAFAQALQCRVGNRIQALADMFNPTRAGISEVVIPPSSKFIKQQVGELHLRKRYGISVLALNRGDEVTRGEDVREMTLRAGDSLVLHSYWRDLALAAESRDLVPVTDIPSVEQRPGKVRYAVVFFALALGLGLFTDLHLSVAMMTGAVGMLLLGVLNMDEAYGAIAWKTIFVMACLIPLGVAMDSTGTAAWMAQEIMRYIGHLPQWAIQAFIAILALVFSQIISHVATAVMMVPMAINIALASGGNPAVYALIVALSVSNTFLLPSASPTLLIIAGPGGYKPRDFARVGLPLTLLMLVVTLVMVNVVFNR